MNHSKSKHRLAVLASGRGSNFENILDATLHRFLDAEIVIFITNNPSSRALSIAQRHPLPSHVLIPKSFPSREAYDQTIAKLLKEAGVELILLAGYNRIIGKPILEAFPDHVLNIHPSLLPSFPGLHAQRQALDAGVKVSGCTVHFVNEALDAGPIILQRTVPVLDDDTEESLADRILKEEHIAYSLAIQLVLEKKIAIQNGRVVLNKS